MFTPASGLWERQPLASKIDHVARGSFLRNGPPDIRGTGYVVQSMEAALWAFARSTTFRQGALLAVNLGDDADTTGAIYGQLAGAFYGVDAIPAEWRSELSGTRDSRGVRFATGKRQMTMLLAARLSHREDKPAKNKI